MTASVDQAGSAPRLGRTVVARPCGWVNAAQGAFATSLGGQHAGFIQIIEYKTSRIDEIQAYVDEQRPRMAEGSTARRVTLTADRDRPGFYLTIVEFDSYESAMENSNRPETAEFAAQMAKLCDGPPTFYNLDVQQVMDPGQG